MPALDRPQIDLPRGVDGGSDVFDDAEAAGILASEYFVAAPVAPSALYLGAAGQSTIHLALRTPAQMTLGPTSLYP